MATSNGGRKTGLGGAGSPDLTVPPPLPIQAPPIFIPPDESTVLTKTVLRNETIWCFEIGGEQRLCLPQLLNTILSDFEINQINQVCFERMIYCSRCSPGQLRALKHHGILPSWASSCGLITRTDAEHIVSALVDRPQALSAAAKSPPVGKMENGGSKWPDRIRVYHDCFGKCTGLYRPGLYHDPTSACIECDECGGLFDPQKFVCHTHRARVTRTIHWGFDSQNWRSYLLLAKEQPTLKQDLSDHGQDQDLKSSAAFVGGGPELERCLLEMKDRFDQTRPTTLPKKRKLDDSHHVPTSTGAAGLDLAKRPSSTPIGVDKLDKLDRVADKLDIRLEQDSKLDQKQLLPLLNGGSTTTSTTPTTTGLSSASQHDLVSITLRRVCDAERRAIQAELALQECRAEIERLQYENKKLRTQLNSSNSHHNSIRDSAMAPRLRIKTHLNHFNLY